MKKALKVLAVIFGGLFIIGAILVLLFVKSLPSTWELKQAISPLKGKRPEFAAPANVSGQNSEVLEATPMEPAKTYEDKVDESKVLSQAVLREDFLNDKKPLSSVCNHLAAAANSHFLRGDESASVNEFMKKLIDEKEKDPLVESAAPLFRYLFRLGHLRELVEIVEKAEAAHDENLSEKAWFYAKVGLAAQEIRTNKANIDRLLMKTYNMYMLSKAVALRPELARDPATLNFCDQIEKNINFNLDFNTDEQSLELQKFFEYAKVNPQEIGYEPDYRSDVNFKFENKSILLDKIWLEKLFAADFKKAQKEFDKNTEPEK